MNLGRQETVGTDEAFRRAAEASPNFVPVRDRLLAWIRGRFVRGRCRAGGYLSRSARAVASRRSSHKTIRRAAGVIDTATTIAARARGQRRVAHVGADAVLPMRASLLAEWIA